MITLGIFLRIIRSLSCLLATKCVLVTHLSVQSETPPEQHTVSVSDIAVQFQTLWFETLTAMRIGDASMQPNRLR